jgi:trk system potassium uptake protein TrkA
MEVSIPEKVVGKSLKELDLRRKHNLNVILKKSGNQTQTTIDPDEKLVSKEILLVIGKEDIIKKVFV